MELIYIIIKKLFDILFSLIGCILLIPISLIIKICFLFTKDFHSIFYIQERIGKNGKLFKILKYRTMYYKADDDLNKILKTKESKKEWKENQKLKIDPRVTKIGKILRKTGIDEIPQFINVLIGNMSIVGPRPLVKNELKEHKGNIKKYQSIKPGITGWWACNKEKASTYKERLKLEYYYIDNRSLLLDIKCILKTIKYIFRKGE